MINAFRNYFRYQRLRKFLTRVFEPHAVFLQQTRAFFIASIAGGEPVRLLRRAWWARGARSGFVILGALVVLNGGATVFAEAANVPPDHPLYRFKRAGEELQVMAAPMKTKLALHHKFARRRLEEIKAMQQFPHRNKKVATLSRALQAHAAAALETFRAAPKPAAERAAFCESLRTLAEEHRRLVPNAAVRWQELERRCATLQNPQPKEN